MPSILADYPFVSVRIECSKCPRLDSYRFPRLVDEFGPDAPLPDVLRALSLEREVRDLERLNELHPCGAFFRDLAPDLPRGLHDD